MRDGTKMYVITNPVPLHNNSPLVSLGKFLRVIDAAGYSAEILGARIPENGIPGKPENMPVKSYRYGGKGALKMLSYIFLQIRMFFSGLFRFKRGDVVYFWIGDKMIGSFTAARLKGAETNYFVYGRVFGGNVEGLSVKLTNHMIKKSTYVCAESPSVFNQWEISEGHKRDSIGLFVPSRDIAPVPFGERAKRVAMFCRLCEGKHIEDSINAFVKIHEKHPDYDLRIIGGGILEDDARKLIRELGAEGFISITGWLDPVSAAKELSRCRVLLFPTDAEGVPGSVLEAMSIGVPVLASPAGGIPDIVKDGVNGVILTATDDNTIAKELDLLLLSDKLDEISASALETIKNEFSLDVAAENFRNIREKHKS